jgi:LruC domain-containing protein
LLNAAEEVGGTVLFKSLTNASGKITGKIKLPAYMDKIVVDPRYLGVMRNAAVNIVNNKITCTLGGASGFSGNVVPDLNLGGRPARGSNFVSRPTSHAYRYMGTYNSQGKPNYLQSNLATISNSFLDYINASLPERKPVPTYHPDYLNSAAETNINLATTSDVYFTFVTEGAGYKNSVAYFTYPTGSKPNSVNDIDTLHIILPNASLNGSGGQMLAGHTINLGRFTAGTSIGFALIANGWNGSTQTVQNNSWTVYSVDGINPSSNASLKRQSVLLYDNPQDLFLVGFEDIRRDDGGCDQDFNDCLFYIKSQTVNAISARGVNPIDTPTDTDGDGVNDTYDDFPNDPARAYINYYPSQHGFGTLAFEDNWPFLGDYDMNDLVVDYRYSVVSNALNLPIEMQAKYVLKASGANFRNGFGVEFPFSASLVSSATGHKVTNSNIVTLAANGLEAGQNKAVVIPFDDAYTVMNATTGFNTYTGGTYIVPDTTNMQITFTRGLTQAEFGTVPFNPFIISNKIRGREIHLPGYAPTQKIDSRYYRTGADNTIPAQNKYFKTTTNLPWAVAFTEQFAYPAENKVISTAYTKFVNWAQSGGTTNTNWYKDSVNMVQSKIYRR